MLHGQTDRIKNIELSESWSHSEMSRRCSNRIACRSQKPLKHIETLGSFSILQHSNKGTRRKACPEGSNTLDREIIGNELLRRTLVLIKILDTAGNKWTLENPRSSYVWLMPNMRKCMQSSKVHGADMHQCAYGLRLKDNQGKYGPCKKHTRFVGSLPGLSSLARSCHCTQPHVHAVGGVKTKQGWKRRSEQAGQYPRPLCDKYAELAAKILG